MKKKPLRGSVRQNVSDRQADTGALSRLGFGARLALLVLGALALLLLISWSWTNRWPHRAVASVQRSALHATQKLGFSLGSVMVEGRRYTERAALLDALDVRMGSPILSFNPILSYEKIAALPWVESAAVIRKLPDAIVVRLNERVPMALWQHEGKTVVIDGQGRPLVSASPEAFGDLPLVAGDAAPEQTRALLLLLRDYPNITEILKAASRVGQRRWNLFLKPNVLVQLPEKDEAGALAQLTHLIEEQKMLERDVAMIDLRIHGRLIVEPEKALIRLQEGKESAQ